MTNHPRVPRMMGFLKHRVYNAKMGGEEVMEKSNQGWRVYDLHCQYATEPLPGRDIFSC